jgi:CRISPR-associated Csx10 family RAMP protein
VPERDYYGRYADTFYTASPLNRRFSRTAINRQRHTAQSGQLFTLTVMGEQMKTNLPEPSPKTAVTRLEGQVEAGDADLTALQDALKQVKWLGSSSSRGLGQIDGTPQVRAIAAATPSKIDSARFQAQVASGKYQPDDKGTADLGNRLAAFNKAIQEERAFYHAIGIPNIFPGWHFSLNLLSDTFMRQGGLPSLTLNPAQLQLPGAELIFQTTVPIERGGWSNAWGLPRYREQGIGRGSVFLFQVNSTDATAVATIMARLAQLEASGLGTDQARGAGRLQVCDPFHQEVNPR